MPTIEESVIINRPVAEVFAVMADGNNAAVYDGSVIRSEQEGDGPPAVGTRWKGATKVLGRQFDWVIECTELEADKAMTVESVEGKLSFTIHTRFTTEAAGTRVDYRLTAESGLGGVFGKIAEPLVVKAQTRTVKANLANLKELMESGAL